MRWQQFEWSLDEGEHWSAPEIGIEGLTTHPRELVTESSAMVLELWQQYERQGAFGGMGGVATFPVVGPLPYAGGYAEQPAALVAAFKELSWTAAQLRLNVEE